MTVNQVGALLGVATLVTIFIWHPRHRATAPVEPAPVVKVIPAPAPVPAPAHSKVERQAPVAHVPLPRPKPHKYTGAINCKYVPAVAHVAPWSAVAAAAEGYGLSPAQIAQVKRCVGK